MNTDPGNPATWVFCFHPAPPSSNFLVQWVTSDIIEGPDIWVLSIHWLISIKQAQQLITASPQADLLEVDI